MVTVGLFVLDGIAMYRVLLYAGCQRHTIGGTCMKHELEQVHIESYGLTGPEVVVAAAIKVYLMNLPWSDAKKKMDAVISLERGAVTVDGRTLSGLVNDSVEYALGAVGQKTELAPELWQTMEAQLKSVNGSVTVQTVATGLLDFLYDCWTSTKR
jgi:hypothetical protein